MSLEKTERDLLIELSAEVKFSHQEQTRMMTEHLKDDARQFGEVNAKVDAAHKRMDTINETLKSFNSIKDKVLGGALVISFCGSFVMAMIMIFKPH